MKATLAGPTRTANRCITAASRIRRLPGISGIKAASDNITIINRCFCRLQQHQLPATTTVVSQQHQRSLSTGRKQKLNPRKIPPQKQQVPIAKKNQSKGPVFSSRHDLKEKLDTAPLQAKTNAWLERLEGNSNWTIQDVALGRSLLNDWLRLPHSHADRAPWAHTILMRWIQACLDSSSSSSGSSSIQASRPELLDMLHRVLFAWRKDALMVRRNGSSHSSNTYYLIPLEESIRLINSMEALYKTTIDNTVLPGPKAFSLVLGTLSLHPDKLESACEDALELLDQCVTNNNMNISGKQQRNKESSASDLIVWNSCLHTLAKCSRYHKSAPKQAEQLLESMILGSSPRRSSNSSKTNPSPAPPQPNVISFASVLDAWATSPQPENTKRARAILDRMMAPRQRGNRNHSSVPAPNTACFNICIGAYARSQEPGSAQQAQDVMDRMQDYSYKSNSNSSNDNARPDRNTFVSVMKAWANCSCDPKSAAKTEAVLERLQQLYYKTGDQAFRPTGSCYAVVLDAYSRTSESGTKVEAMLKRMEQETFLNSTLDQGEQDSQMNNKHGQSPIQTGYLAAIRAWGNTRGDVKAPEHAGRLLRYMEEQSLVDKMNDRKPDAAIYTAVITSWSKSSRVDAPLRALDILRRMQDENSVVQPDTVTFNSVMNVFAKQGDSEGALALLDEMKDAACHRNSNTAKADSMSYATAIHALARSQNIPDAAKRASDLLEELIDCYEQSGDNDMLPTQFAYGSAITAWSNSGDIDCGEKAETLFWEMQNLPERLGKEVSVPKPNTLVCNGVLRTWSLSPTGNSPDRAESFLQWMHDQVSNGDNRQVSPDIVSYIYVMRAWGKSRRASSVRRIESHLNTMLDLSKNKEGHPLCPNVSTYNLLLSAIQNSSDNDRAQKCQLLLHQLVNASSSNRKDDRLWDLTSFRCALLACLPSIRVSKVNSHTTVEVVEAIFEDLKTACSGSSSNTVCLSNEIIETLLRVYLTTSSDRGADRNRFLSDAFKFCSRKKDEVNMREILASFQRDLPQYEYLILATAAEEFL